MHKVKNNVMICKTFKQSKKSGPKLLNACLNKKEQIDVLTYLVTSWKDEF